MIDNYISICALLLSLLAVVVSVYFSLLSKKHNRIIRTHINDAVKKASKALLNVQNGLELTLNRQLVDAKNKVDDLAESLFKYKLEHPDGDDEVYKKKFKGAVEGLLNSYEQYCDFYLTDSINKERFEKQKHLEIKELFKGDVFKNHLEQSSEYDYSAIIKVYKILEAKKIPFE